jgi:hypothetical protein
MQRPAEPPIAGSNPALGFLLWVSPLHVYLASVELLWYSIR